MKYFTIDAENNITVHVSRNAARETGDGVFSTEVQFADLIGPDNKRLLDIWNSLPGVKPVTKFTNRKIATERIWRAIQSLGGTIHESDPKTPFDQADESAPVGAQAAEVAPAEAKANNKATQTRKARTGENKPNVAREGSKTDQAIAMMKRPGGATLPELMATFGWQTHTVRGFVAGALTKKLGLTVASTKPVGGERTYSIAK